jgi:hypothetical protein
MSTQQATYETVTERPTFTTNRTKTKAMQSFSAKIRELPESEYLPVPADMDIKSVRTMATRIGPKCDPPRKYSVRKAIDGFHYVFWGDEPTEATDERSIEELADAIVDGHAQIEALLGETD